MFETQEIFEELLLLGENFASEMGEDEEALVELLNQLKTEKEASVLHSFLYSIFRGNEQAQKNILQRLRFWENKWLADTKTILVVGGENKKTGSSDKMLVLSKDRSRWRTASVRLPVKTTFGGCVYLKGEIYIFGGESTTQQRYNHLFKLDPQMMKWVRLTDMHETRTLITSSYVVFEGCIWVFGGYSPTKKTLRTVEMYNPQKDEWILMPEMIHGRDATAAEVCNGKIFVCGGSNGTEALNNAEMFDPKCGMWIELVNIPKGLFGHAIVAHGTDIFLIGGSNGSEDFNSVWKINTNNADSGWQLVQPIKHRRDYFATVSLGEELFVIGGLNEEGSLKEVEVFNEKYKMDGVLWRDGPVLPEISRGPCATLIPQKLADDLCVSAPKRVINISN